MQVGITSRLRRFSCCARRASVQSLGSVPPLFSRCRAVCLDVVAVNHRSSPLGGQRAKHPLPEPALGLTNKAIIDRGGRAIFQWAITPTAAALDNVHDTDDHTPVIAPLPCHEHPSANKARSSTTIRRPARKRCAACHSLQIAQHRETTTDSGRNTFLGFGLSYKFLGLVKTTKTDIPRWVPFLARSFPRSGQPVDNSPHS